MTFHAIPCIKTRHIYISLSKMKNQNILNYCIVFSIGAFACIFAIEQIYNYDIWWHLKTGQWIIANHRIPHADPFPTSTQGAPWIYTSWLAGVLFALIEQVAGLDPLILFKALLIGAAFGGAGLYLVKKEVNPYVAAFILGYAIIVARFRFLLRPQLFMFIFSLVLFWMLAEKASRGKKISLLLVPLTIVWVNLHGSAYLAPVFGAFLFIEQFLGWLIKRRQRPDETFPSFSLVLTLSLAAAVLVTPYGLELPKQIISRTLFADLITRSYSVEEHLPLVWGSHPLYWALLITTAVTFLLSWRRNRIFNVLVFLGTAYISLSSVRYVGLAAFLHAMLLCLNIHLLTGRVQPAIPFRGTKLQHVLMPAILLTLAIWSFNSTFSRDKVYRWGLGINTSRYPVAAVEYLRRIGFTGTVFNSWQYGGYLLWFLPDARTTIDGRTLPDQLILYNKLLALDLYSLHSYLDRNNVRAALLARNETQFSDLFSLSPRYKLTLFDDSHLLFLHRDLLTAEEEAESLSYRYIRPEAFDMQYLIPLARGTQADEVEQELRTAVQQNPEVFSLALQLATFLDLRNRAEAVDSYLAAAKINPILAFTHYNLGLLGARAGIKHQRWKEVAEIIQMARDQGQMTPELFFLLGNAQYQLKDLTGARQAFEQSIARQADNAAAHMNLGYVLLDTGEFRMAAKHFEEALQLNSDLEGASYGYALALEKSGDTRAQEAWKNFLTRFPDSRWAPRARQFIRQ